MSYNPLLPHKFSGSNFISYILNNGIFLISFRYLSAFLLAWINRVEVKWQFQNNIPIARFDIDAVSFSYLNAYSVLLTTAGACLFFWLSRFNRKFEKELIWANYLGTFTGIVQFGVLITFLSKSYNFQLIHSFVWALLPFYLLNVCILYLLLKRRKSRKISQDDPEYSDLDENK